MTSCTSTLSTLAIAPISQLFLGPTVAVGRRASPASQRPALSVSRTLTAVDVLSMALGVIQWVVALLLCASVATSMDVSEFFPEIDGDMTRVTWAHAVNSDALLEASLAGDVMMLEADVSLGTLLDGDGDVIPVMAHPPANTSDLSLADFLARVVAKSTKGVKLDFKTTDALDKSLVILSNISAQLTFPVWLNADILVGPVSNTGTPVDADVFLRETSSAFPASTLSVGWTTSWGPLTLNGSYTDQHVDEMATTLADNAIRQAVTFPVRAGPAAHSIDTLPRLVNTVANSTLTIWGSETDRVNHEKLARLVLAVGRGGVFIDLPARVRAELDRWLDQLEVGNGSSTTTYADLSI